MTRQIFGRGRATHSEGPRSEAERVGSASHVVTKRPFLSRFSVEDRGAALRFIFPYRKQWFQILILALVFAVLLAIYIPFILNLLTNSLRPPTGNMLPVFLLNVVLLLVVSGTWVVELLWQLTGKEIVEISDEGITLRHHVLGLEIPRRHPAYTINGLFVSRQKDGWLPPFGSSMVSAFTSFKRGKIAFNSGRTILGGAVTFRFGSILDEEEAKQIVTIIHQRFPRYRYKATGVG